MATRVQALQWICFTMALQEQLRLTLETKGPVEFSVIDRIERSSAN